MDHPNCRCTPPVPKKPNLTDLLNLPHVVYHEYPERRVLWTWERMQIKTTTKYYVIFFQPWRLN